MAGFTAALSMREVKKKIRDDPKDKRKKVKGQARAAMQDEMDSAKEDAYIADQKSKQSRRDQRQSIARNKTVVASPTGLGGQAEAIRKLLTGQ